MSDLEEDGGGAAGHGDAVANYAFEEGGGREKRVMVGAVGSHFGVSG